MDNLNNVRREASRLFRNKQKEYLEAKIEELENNSKIKNIRALCRGNSDFKKGYQPRTDVVKDEKCGLVADCYSIVARWRDYFSQLLNVHGVNDIKHTVIQTAESLVPEQNAFEFELAIEKLRSPKTPGIDQIRADLIEAGVRKICHEIRKLIVSIWNK